MRWLVQGGCKLNHDIGHVPDFVLATTLVGTGAYFRSTRILIAVGCYQGRNGDVGGGAGRNGIFEAIKLMKRVIHVKICWEPFGGPFVTGGSCQ